MQRGEATKGVHIYIYICTHVYIHIYIDVMHIHTCLYICTYTEPAAVYSQDRACQDLPLEPQAMGYGGGEGGKGKGGWNPWFGWLGLNLGKILESAFPDGSMGAI